MNNIRFIRYSLLACLVLAVLLWRPTIAIGAENLHEWGPWIVDKEPTCISEGHKYRVCTTFPDWPHQEDKAIPKLDHHVFEKKTIEPTCTTAGKVISTCIYCGLTEEAAGKPALGHEWGDWVTIREATESRQGLLQRVCSRDTSHIERKAVAALPAPNLLDKLTEKHPVNTVDVMMIAGSSVSFIWLGLLIFFDFQLIFWVVKKRRNFLKRQRAAGKGGWGIKK